MSNGGWPFEYFAACVGCLGCNAILWPFVVYASPVCIKYVALRTYTGVRNMHALGAMGSPPNKNCFVAPKLDSPRHYGARKLMVRGPDTEDLQLLWNECKAIVYASFVPPGTYVWPPTPPTATPPPPAYIVESPLPVTTIDWLKPPPATLPLTTIDWLKPPPATLPLTSIDWLKPDHDQWDRVEWDTESGTGDAVSMVYHEYSFIKRPCRIHRLRFKHFVCFGCVLTHKDMDPNPV